MKQKGYSVSNSKRVAFVNMEEEYMRLQIDYKDSEDRTIICTIIDNLERELDAHPEVMHKRDKDGGGTYYIEFSKEPYSHSRIPGEFIEKLLKILNIEHCEEL
jgi:hypothetical protein